MKLVVLVALVAACGTTPAPTRAWSSDVPSQIARIETRLGPERQIAGEEEHHSLEDRMREWKIPAVSIAVFAKHELVWAKAYGFADVDGKKVATSETLFQAASISKPVHALGVMLAVADKTLLSLDAPINDQLASWKLPETPFTKNTPVTLRHLLSHTGGTTVHGFPGYKSDAALPTTQQILDGAPPANTPAIRVDIPLGTFRYSGGGTTITQLALVDRSKRPYPEILATRVLGPLGMTRSTFEQPLPASRAANAASAYRPDGSMVAGRYHAYPEMAPAGLWTTPTDLARFFAEISLARGGRSDVISRAIAVEMTTKVGDGPTGLGPFLEERDGVTFFGHDGGNEGFRCKAIASLDEGYGVVIMTNSDNGGRILDEIEQAVFAEYGWPGTAKPIVRFAMAPETRARFVAAYAPGGFGPLVIEDRGGKLVFGPPLGRKDELVPINAATLVGPRGERVRVSPDGVLELSSRDDKPLARFSRIGTDAQHPLLELAAGRFDAAVAAWKKRDPNAARAEENFANMYGYQLLDDFPGEAVLVLRLVAAVFPDSSNAHDSLGEAYMRTGDKANAIAAYEKALATLDADPRMTAERKPGARASAEKQLAALRSR